jgi:uncharacterized membrane protein HdeD (DUF308 family)
MTVTRPSVTLPPSAPHDRKGVGQLSRSSPTPRGRLPLGKALGQSWALWLAGLLALAGGLVLLVNPGAGLRLVRWLLGLFLLGWGVLRLVHAVAARPGDRAWLVVSGLLIGLGGVLVLTWPGITLTALVSVLVIAGCSFAAVDLVGAVVTRRTNPRWWLYLLRGLGTLVLVLLLLAWPDRTLAAVRVLTGILLILWGASTLGEAYDSPIRDRYRGELDQQVRRII